MSILDMRGCYKQHKCGFVFTIQMFEVFTLHCFINATRQDKLNLTELIAVIESLPMFLANSYQTKCPHQ